jgi:hypothetical protein
MADPRDRFELLQPERLRQFQTQQWIAVQLFHVSKPLLKEDWRNIVRLWLHHRY